MSPDTANIPIHKRLILSCFISCMVFLGLLSALTNEVYRRNLQWELGNSVAVALCILLLALGLFALSLCLSRSKYRRLDELFSNIYWFAPVAGYLNIQQLDFNGYPTLNHFLWICAFLLLGYFIGRPKPKVIHYARNFCLIFSPLVLVLLIQLFFCPPWGTAPRSKLTFQRARSPANPVFLFIFDEWSYSRSTTGSEFLPVFPNLQALCAQAVLFTQAFSTTDTTYTSLPGAIFQTDKELIYDGGKGFFEQGEERIESATVPSIFMRARELDYNSALIGFALPYGNILGDQADYYAAFSQFPTGNNLADRMLFVVIDNLRIWTGPVTHALGESLYARRFSHYWVQMHAAMSQETLDLIEKCPDNTLALFHWPHPHPPFVFNGDGSYRGPFQANQRVEGTPEDYQRHLLYLDLLIGRFMGKLRDAKKFDPALIIVTSDHTWREDPELTRSKHPERQSRHVPLIIKLPHQKASHVVSDEVYIHRLQPLLDMVLRGETDESRLLEAIRGDFTED